MAATKRSLTGILRELHQQLDPEAPRHMPLAERQAAVAPLLGALGSVGEALQDAVDAATAGNEGGNGGSSNDRRGNESSPARRAGTRTADGTGKPQGQASQQRREARGVRVVSTDPQPSEPAAPKPVTRKPVVKPKSGDSNAAKLWRLLIG